MSHAFKVSWLISICSKFYKDLVGSVTTASNFDLLLFLFEEARYISSYLNCDSFINMMVEKIASLENCAQIFVEPYMKINKVLSTAQLDLVIRVTQNFPLSLFNFVKENIEDNAFKLNGTSLYLIENLDLFKCVSQDSVLYEEIFDVILKKPQNLTMDEIIRVNKIYRSVTRKYYNAVKLKSIDINPRDSGLHKPSIPVRRPILNLFCSFIHYQDMELVKFLELAHGSPNVSNMYMLLEGVFTICCRRDLNIIPDALLKLICDIRKRNKWNEISKIFLDSWEECRDVAQQMLCSNIVSDSEHKHCFGEVVSSSGIYDKTFLTARTLFYTRKDYLFKLAENLRPETCTDPGNCGFLLRIHPRNTVPGASRYLDITLVENQAEYPPGVHLHHGIVKASKLHIMLMGSFKEDKFALLCSALSWNEHGLQVIFEDRTKNENHKVQLGIWKFWLDSPLRLVAFIV